MILKIFYKPYVRIKCNFELPDMVLECGQTFCKVMQGEAEYWLLEYGTPYLTGVGPYVNDQLWGK